MNFQSLVSHVSEAFKLKDASKFQLRRKGGIAYQNETVNKAFNGKDRIVKDFPFDFPFIFDKSDQLKEVYKKVKIALSNSSKLREVFKGQDIQITPESYIKGYAIIGKQQVRIGKLLEKIEDGYLLKLYKMDGVRQMDGKTYKIVISRHPYDIAGASTDKEWTSCMTMGTYCPVYKRFTENDEVGSNRAYLLNDIQMGSLVAYLVDDKDRHPNGKIAVRKPISRILIKPFDGSTTNDVKYGLGQIYGVKISLFKDELQKWVDENLNNSEFEDDAYFLRLGLYNDGEVIYAPNKPIRIVAQKNKTLEKWVKETLDKVNASAPKTDYQKFKILQNGDMTDISISIKLPPKLKEIFDKHSSRLINYHDQSVGRVIIRKYFQGVKKWYYVNYIDYDNTTGIVQISHSFQFLRMTDYVDTEFQTLDEWEIGNNVERLTDMYYLSERMRDDNIDDLIEDYFNWKEYKKFFINELKAVLVNDVTDKQKNEAKKSIEAWFVHFKESAQEYVKAKTELQNKLFHNLSHKPEENCNDSELLGNYFGKAGLVQTWLTVLQDYLKKTGNPQMEATIVKLLKEILQPRFGIIVTVLRKHIFPTSDLIDIFDFHPINQITIGKMKEENILSVQNINRIENIERGLRQTLSEIDQQIDSMALPETFL